MSTARSCSRSSKRRLEDHESNTSVVSGDHSPIEVHCKKQNTKITCGLTYTTSQHDWPTSSTINGTALSKNGFQCALQRVEREHQATSETSVTPAKPLNAYNLFFRDERARIITMRQQGTPVQLLGASEANSANDPSLTSRASCDKLGQQNQEDSSAQPLPGDAGPQLTCRSSHNPSDQRHNRHSYNNTSTNTYSVTRRTQPTMNLSKARHDQAPSPDEVDLHRCTLPFFQRLAKHVGYRWKRLPQNERAKYTALAKQEKQRYEAQMNAYRDALLQETRERAANRVAHMLQQENMTHTPNIDTNTMTLSQQASGSSHQQHRAKELPSEYTSVLFCSTGVSCDRKLLSPPTRLPTSLATAKETKLHTVSTTIPSSCYYRTCTTQNPTLDAFVGQSYRSFTCAAALPERKPQPSSPALGNGQTWPLRTASDERTTYGLCSPRVQTTCSVVQGLQNTVQKHQDDADLFLQSSLATNHALRNKYDERLLTLLGTTDKKSSALLVDGSTTTTPNHDHVSQQAPHWFRAPGRLLPLPWQSTAVTAPTAMQQNHQFHQPNQQKPQCFLLLGRDQQSQNSDLFHTTASLLLGQQPCLLTTTTADRTHRPQPLNRKDSPQQCAPPSWPEHHRVLDQRISGFKAQDGDAILRKLGFSEAVTKRILPISDRKQLTPETFISLRPTASQKAATWSEMVAMYNCKLARLEPLLQQAEVHPLQSPIFLDPEIALASRIADNIYKSYFLTQNVLSSSGVLPVLDTEQNEYESLLSSLQLLQEPLSQVTQRTSTLTDSAFFSGTVKEKPKPSDSIKHYSSGHG